MKQIIKLLAILALILTLLASCSKSPEELYQEQYELGMKYLTEANYEEAIIAFEAAIEIEPKNVESYIALADVYIANGDIATAIEVLSNVPEELQGNQVLADKIAAVLTETVMNDDGSYHVIQYDDNANIITISYYFADGTLDIIEEYDESGKVFKESSYLSDGTLYYWHFVEEYHENDIRAKIRAYNEGSPGYHISEFYEDGKNYKTAWYGSDDTVSSWHIYEYHDNGNYAITTTYNADGSVHKIDESNEDGVHIKSTLYNLDGSVNSWHIPEYDENGNNIKTTSYDADGVVYNWTVYEYDANGNKIKTTDYNGDGSVNRWYVDEYDENGKHVNRTAYNADGSVRD